MIITMFWQPRAYRPKKFCPKPVPIFSLAAPTWNFPSKKTVPPLPSQFQKALGLVFEISFSTILLKRLLTFSPFFFHLTVFKNLGGTLGILHRRTTRMHTTWCQRKRFRYRENTRFNKAKRFFHWNLLRTFTTSSSLYVCNRSGRSRSVSCLTLELQPLNFSSVKNRELRFFGLA